MSERGIPEKGTYKHVLCSFKIPPAAGACEACLRETGHARRVEWPVGLAKPAHKVDEIFYPHVDGSEVLMMFVTTPELRERLWRLHWRDITEEWDAWQKGQEQVVLAKVPNKQR